MSHRVERVKYMKIKNNSPDWDHLGARLADRRDDLLGDPVLELAGRGVLALGAEDDLVEAAFGDEG